MQQSKLINTIQVDLIQRHESIGRSRGALLARTPKQGAVGTHPQTGSNSFVFTQGFCQKAPALEVGAPNG